MKKLILKICILVTFLGSFDIAKATHVLGLDATWKNQGNDTFIITLNCYRRCTDGALALTVLNPTISSDSCNNNIAVSNFVLIKDSIADITPYCKNVGSICPAFGGSGTSSALIPLGIELHSWTFKVFLGDSFKNCCWYKIRWQLCCRSSIITTGLSDGDFIQEFWLNRCIINNSPKFTSDALSIKVVGKDYSYNLGMVDNEHDSLSYHLNYPPLGASYASSWSSVYPLTCYGGNVPCATCNPPTGFNLDSVTGDLIFRGAAVQASVIKITVKEWRKINGVMKVIGVTSRDLQINMLASNTNKLPSIVSSSNTFTLCPGNQFCFNITTSDQDATDTTTIRSNATQVFPGAVFTRTPDTAKRASATFCWTPDTGYISNRPYYFQVRVADNCCPLNNVVYKTFTINVNPKYNVSTRIERLNCTDYNFLSMNSPSLAKSKWQIFKGTTLVDSFINRDTVLNYKFKTTGTYYVFYSSVNSGCSYTNTDTVIISSATVLLMNNTHDTTLCKGNIISLNATPLNGLPPFKYKWYLNGALVDTSQSITVTPMVTSNYIVEVYSNDTCKSNNKDTITIKIDSAGLKVDTLPDSISLCLGLPLIVTPVIQTGNLPIKYEWYKNSSLISSSATLNVSNPDTGYYYVNIKSANNCFNQILDSFYLKADSMRLLVDSIRDTTICKGSYYNITPNVRSFKSPLIYEWYNLNGQLLSNALNFSVDSNITKTYILKINSNDICYNPFIDTFKVNIDTGKIKVKSPLRDTVICAGNPFDASMLVISGSLPFQYSWYRGGNLVSSSPSFIPLVSDDYILKIVSSDNCANTFQDTMNIRLDTSGVKLSKLIDKNVCLGSVVSYAANIISGKLPFTYKWYLNSSLIATTPTVNFTVGFNVNCILEVTSGDSCSNVWRDTAVVSTGTTKLSVEPFRDTTICIGADYIIGAKVNNGTAPYQYKWYRNGAFISNAPSITIVTNDSATYILDLISADYCINHFRDTFKLSLFPKKQLNISAATTIISPGEKVTLRSNGNNYFTWLGAGILTNWNDSVLVQPSTTTTYTLISENQFGCKDTIQITIKVTSGINNIIRTEASFEIFPNPAFDNLIINFTRYESGTIQLLNLLGEVLKERKIENKTETLDIHELSSGLYFIKVGSEVKRFVKE